MTRSDSNRAAIASLLMERDGYMSGATIADSLGITRAAVWKAIKQLQKRGYVIESAPARGYRLINAPDLSPEEIRKTLAGHVDRIGTEIRFFNEVDSTNRVAMELAAEGCSEGTVVVADTQSAGRGRLGRAWMSPPAKNLNCSIVLRPPIPPRDATALTLLSAIACTSALRSMTALQCTIKWPNDVLVGGRKIAGILTELRAEADTINFAVIGVGINVNLAVADLPEALQETATSLHIETGETHARTQVLCELLREFDRWYATLLQKGKGPLLESWRAMSSTLGRQVRVTLGSERLDGLAEAIDEDGMLVVRLSDGTYRTISAGDVCMVRPAS